MKKNLAVAATAAMMLMLVACAGKRDDETAATTGEAVPATATTDSQSSGVAPVSAGEGVTSQGALGPEGSLGSQRVIYFDFDSSDIRPEYVDVIGAHGRFLGATPTVRVRLEGHTDERGSREYNIGLAERRAQTVRRALALQGVQESQISTVSYGEERPAASGSDENAYSKNRRVEIVYIN